MFAAFLGCSKTVCLLAIDLAKLCEIRCNRGAGQVIRKTAHREKPQAAPLEYIVPKTTSPRSRIQLLVPLLSSNIVASSEEAWAQVVSLTHLRSSQVSVLFDAHASLPIEVL